MSALDIAGASKVAISTMTQQPRTRARGRRGPVAGGPGTHSIWIKGATPELHKRFKIASVEAGLAYHQFIDLLLDEHESRKRRRLGQMKSPLHRVTESLDDDMAEDMDPRDVVGL